jgi:hypothetical protein
MLLAGATEAAAVQMAGRKVRSAAMVYAARVMARLPRGIEAHIVLEGAEP